MKWAMLCDIALIISGLATLIVGITYWSTAAALIVAGIALIALGVMPTRPPWRL